MNRNRDLSPRLVERARRDSLLIAAVNHGVPHSRDWTMQASCRTGGPDDETWFPDTYGVEQIRAAAKTCRHCPVKLACLASALNADEHGDIGVAAGTTPAQRRTMRAALRIGLETGAAA